MVADWLAAIILDFGHRLGLSNFALNERESASVTFENGIGFNMEHNGENLYIFTTCPMTGNEASYKFLLQSSHPDNQYQFPVRAAYQEKAGNAMFLIKINDRDASQPLLEGILNCLWKVTTAFMSRLG